MDAQRTAELTAELNATAERFWAAEASIARAFFSRSRTADEHARWLRVQVFKEMYGSGLFPGSGGIIMEMIEGIRSRLDGVRTVADRAAFERDLRVLREEFTHYRLFADALEEITGEPMDRASIKGWQPAQDKRLAEVRRACRERDAHLGALAVGFTEGGGSSLFAEGRRATGGPADARAAQACEVVYQDELEHAEHGASGLVADLSTEAEWASVLGMLREVCEQRLRMRAEMFGLPLDETWVAGVAGGASGLYAG
jgi:hypothetical protein